MSANAIVIIAAVVGPLGAYLVAARQFSGKIGSSTAADLWAESRSIRDWSQERINALTEEIGRCVKRNAELEAIIVDLRVDIARLKEELKGRE